MRSVNLPSWKISGQSTQQTKLEQRQQAFWANVSFGHGSDACWMWNGPVDEDGYGLFRLSDGTRIGAHRMSWAMEHGDPGDLCVLHRCDNTACVRPDHLFLGTRADNCNDMHAKGRAVTPEPTAKLTREQVVTIRELRHAGSRPEDLARVYGVKPAAIYALCIGETWPDVGGPLTRCYRQRRDRKVRPSEAA